MYPIMTGAHNCALLQHESVDYRPNCGTAKGNKEIEGQGLPVNFLEKDSEI
jgi:hypothetical protein